MALRIQCRWRIKQGGFALHLKKQAHKAAAEQLELETRMAIRVQCRWRIRSGGLALHLKRMAKRDADRLDLENRMALRIQCRWRIRQGGFAAHLARLGKAEQAKQGELEDRTAKALQRWWKMIIGRAEAKSLHAAVVKSRQQKAQYLRLRFRAVLLMQSRWRGIKTRMKTKVEMTKLRKMINYYYKEDRWTVHWDDANKVVYYFNARTKEKTTDEPEGLSATDKFLARTLGGVATREIRSMRARGHKPGGKGGGDGEGGGSVGADAGGSQQDVTTEGGEEGYYHDEYNDEYHAGGGGDGGDGWTEYHDDDSGLPYWYHEATGESSWVDPTGGGVQFA